MNNDKELERLAESYFSRPRFNFDEAFEQQLGKEYERLRAEGHSSRQIIDKFVTVIDQLKKHGKVTRSTPKTSEIPQKEPELKKIESRPNYGAVSDIMKELSKGQIPSLKP